ncbi:hypothetical protein LF1_25030 [Rubripirellula obstinata]|uniref:Uncharacterized protein n=1 Tax=Rubripirellula obstinata TaxID=406547 RepID=A0A5B1CJ59_9BACT|nr:hypothetical protein [Rubripirellula obstinata]KAA1259965.1 hypothetical protein LF1_25030 [Rubripirellula obstinata]
MTPDLTTVEATLNREPERQIAMSTAAGREALAVHERVMRSLTRSQKLAKAFELTHITRELMRVGIRRQHPKASDTEIQRLYVHQLLEYQNLDPETLAECQKRVDKLHQNVATSD